MKIDVNLISTATKKDLVLQKHKRQLKQFSVLIMGLFISVSLIVLVIISVLNKKFNSNQTIISSLKIQIKKYEKNESFLVTITNRLDAIEKLLRSRKSYSKTVADLKLLLIPEFSPQTLEIIQDGGLKITGECGDVQSLATFNQIVEQITTGKYSKVIYPSVSKSKSGKYSISLELK